MAKAKKCEKCGQEIDKKTKVCPNCGAEIKKKPIYKKWWFWVIIAILLISAFSNGDDADTKDTKAETEASETEEVKAESAENEDEPDIKLSTEFEEKIWKIVSDFDGELSLIETTENEGRNTVVAAVRCENDENVVNGILNKISEEIINSEESTEALVTFGDINEGEDAVALVMGTVDTDGTISTTVMSSDYNSARSIWIRDQFSAWDGSHRQLEDLIIKNLNDEKSYKHIETTYRDIATEEDRDEVNNILANAGYSDRVEVGDLLIQTQFSAKNAFNATIKSTAYGIASYQNDTIKLIGIE